jgi:O-antigen/teichoic acid export membrane protein
MTAIVRVRGFLYSSAIYGAADAVVLAVGGLLLLPLYMRTLSQLEFGSYVIVKTNAELFTYVLFFGLPSAAARVYFDNKGIGRQVEYMGSVINLFLFSLAAFGAVLYFWGDQIWKLLSPTTPATPYLWFSVALASTSFFASMGPLWLRLEGRVHAFVTVQIGSSVVLAAAAVVALMVLHEGLRGLIFAMLVSSACSSLVLPWLFGRRYRPRIEIRHVSESLRFAAPIVIGYVAYFVLNRIGTVILQRHVAADQIAIFGLAQQLAMIVSIVGTAFGKAMQPAVYAAEPAMARDLLDRAGQMLIVIMFGFSNCLVLFIWEALEVIAPKSYAPSFEIFLILAWSNLAYSFNLISSTALFYHRRPKTSVAISIGGASLSATLSLWLIPLHQLHGAAIATAVAFAVMSLGGQWITKRLTGVSLIGPMLLTLLATAVVSLFAYWVRGQDFSALMAIGLKSIAAALIGIAMYAIVRTGRPLNSRNA